MKDETPLIFQIDTQTGNCIDLSLMRLHLGFHITNRDGSWIVPVEASESQTRVARAAADTQMSKDDATSASATTYPALDESVLPVSAPLYSLFRDLKVFWNQAPVFYSNFMYPWYTDYVLKMKLPQSQRKALYESAKYYNDRNDLLSVYQGERQIGYDGDYYVPSWEDRSYKYSESQYVEVAGPLLHDLQFQNKLLRDDVNIRIEMTLAKPEFSLFAGHPNKNYSVHLEKAICIVPRVSVSPQYMAPTRSLESEYFFVQHDLSIHVIPKDTLNFSKQVANGVLPRRICFMMVKEQSYNGACHLSPFNYGHNDINFIQLQVGGKQKFPFEPLMPDFENDNYVETYMSLFDNMHNSLGLAGLPFNLDEFKQGNFMFCLDLTKDFSSGSAHWTELGSGLATLNLQFAKPTTENVILICIKEMERVCNIDEQGRAEITDAPLY